MTSNPFIDSLPDIHSYDDFVKLIEVRPDMLSTFKTYGHDKREECMTDDLFIGSRLAWDIYQDISRIIRKGYRSRNPLDNSFIKHNHDWSFRKDELNRESFNVKGGIAGVITGDSGLGKTTLINRVLELIPQTRVHSFITSMPDAQFLQVVWIKIDCEADSRKETLLNIARQVQSHVTQDLGISRLSELRTAQLRKAVVAICRQFAVGLVVIDECQTLTSLSFDRDDKTTSTEFLEKLYQDLGIPLLTIGTPEYRGLLSLRGQTYRRMTQNLSLQLSCYDESDEFWSKLVQVYICNYVFPGSSMPEQNQLEFIHSCTCGNVSLLQKLCSAMLILRERGDYKSFDNDFLQAAYQRVKADFVVSKRLLNLGTGNKEQLEGNDDLSKLLEPSPKRNESKQDTLTDDAGEHYINQLLQARSKR